MMCNVFLHLKNEYFDFILSRVKYVRFSKEHTYIFYSDLSLTVKKIATLSTPPSTGLSGIQFSNYRLTRIYLYLLQQAISACVAAVKSRPVLRPQCSCLYLLVFLDHLV